MFAVKEGEPGTVRTTGDPPPPPRRSRGEGLRRLLSEPLTHFVVGGFVLFLVGHMRQIDLDVHRIVVTPARSAELANAYALQFGAKPDAPTLDALVDRDVHDEILVRQALALGLDRDDQIVRRRLVQKMQFLLQDLNAPAEPTEAQLAAYYRAHADRYASPSRTTFSHVFFASDTAGDAAARARAQAVLRTLADTTARAPDKGDPFPDLYDFAAYEPEQVYRLFGHSPFAEAVQTAPVGRWVGPVKSSYGWHLLHVDSRQAGGLAPLAQVRESVRNDDVQSRQDAANQAAFDKLAKSFRIVRQDKGAAP